MKPFAVVFDFDKTLTTRHLWHLVQGGHPNESHIDDARWPALERQQILERHDFLVDEVMGGAERVATLDRFMQELRDQGGELYISSLNYLTTIQRALEQLNLLRHFTAINARDAMYISLEYNVVTGVTRYGTHTKENYLVEFITLHYNCTVFIDDEMRRIRQAQLIGAYNLKQLDVHGHHGMDAVDLDRIRDALRLCGAPQLRCSVCRISQALYYYEAGDRVVCHTEACTQRAAYLSAKRKKEEDNK